MYLKSRIFHLTRFNTTIKSHLSCNNLIKIQRICFSEKNENESSIEKHNPETNRQKTKILPQEKKLPIYIKHKWGISLISLSVLPLILNHFLLGFTLFGLGLCDIFRKEHGFLRIFKLYIDLNENNDLKMKNLNLILVQKLVENEYVKPLVTDETSICFSQGSMVRFFSNDAIRIRGFSKPEDTISRMQKKYEYTLNFFDLTTGTFGRIKSNCIYNHDEDYYFQKIIVNIIQPKNVAYLILDSDTIDI